MNKMNPLFTADLLRIVQRFESKGQCLEYMAQLLAQSGCLMMVDRYLASIKSREDVMSTGIGHGIAIPHARDESVTCLRIAVCLIREGMDFMALDDQPVSLVFMLAVPEDKNKEYMKILRSLSEYLRQEDLRQRLFDAKDERELFGYVQEIERDYLARAL
ncbi:MAG: PTS sugar transporter subunit IIA [Candidatus Cloacimonetes bacterium]|nr:PTS sugar transporter subunit IIA [Candidatus Cloacimonadota bacterium]